MKCDPQNVRDKLYRQVLLGYVPRYDSESCDDHGCDWLALPEKEFEDIRKRALADRKAILLKQRSAERIRKAKTRFWGVMQRRAPIFVTIALFLLVYLVIPVVQSRKDIDHLQKEVARLQEELRAVRAWQSSLERSVARSETRMPVDAIHSNEETPRKSRPIYVNLTDADRQDLARDREDNSSGAQDDELNRTVETPQQQLTAGSELHSVESGPGPNSD